MFRKDMDRSNHGRCHPNNIWALTGLANCLKEKRTQIPDIEKESINGEISEIESKLILLQSLADSDVSVACMCATAASLESSSGVAKRLKTCCS